MRSPREADRQRAVPRRAGDGVVDLLEVPAVLQRRQGRLLVGLEHLGHGHAGRPQAVDDLVAAPRLAPARQLLVDGVVLRPAGPPPSPDPVSIAHSGSPSACRRPSHWSSSVDRDGDPGIAPAVVVGVRGQVEVLGRGRRPSVPVPPEHGAVGGVLHDLLGGDAQRRVHHRRLDEDAFPGLPAVLQGDEQAAERVGAGVGVAQAVGRHRVLVGVPGHPGEAGGVLDHEGEGRLVPPGPVEPEAGHADHDDVGPDGADGVERRGPICSSTRGV